jgi:hypothetical protein
MRRWIGRVGVGVAAGLLATLIPAAAGATTSPGWRVTEVYSGVNSLELADIAATSANDAWISGTTLESLVVDHWTDGKWRTLPDPAGFADNGNGVYDEIIAASGPTNAWTFPVVGGTAQYALEWNGHSWKTFTLNSYLLTDAAVFSPSDAWVFGAGKPPTTKYPALGAPYVRRFNGHEWQQAATPPGVVIQVSKLSASDFWGFGPSTETAGDPVASWNYLAMRWNGKKWLSFGIAREAPVDGNSWYVTGMVALSDKNVWVTEGVAASVSSTGIHLTPGVALLHWNGSNWQTVVEENGVFPTWGFAYDGHGGFWFPDAADGDLLHYSGGLVTEQAAPAIKGYRGHMVGPLAYIPGTESLWGLDILSRPGVSGSDESGIAKYGP